MSFSRMIAHCLSVVIFGLLLTGAKSQSVLSTTKVGGNGGAAYTDQTFYSTNGALSALKIWIDGTYHVINAIQAQYGTTTWATAHGGGAGFYGTPQTITLSAGESITAVTLASAAATGSATVCVCYLKFETDQGRTFGPYDGGCGAGSATRFILGNGLAYLSGASGNLLDALVVNYFPSCVAGAQPPKIGGTGGGAYTDQTLYNTNGPLTGLKIWIDSNSRLINSFQAQYGTVWSSVHGGAVGQTGAAQVITLNAGETITAITGATSSGTGCGACVCYLKFETSAGRTFGPYDAGCGAGSAKRYTLGNGLSYLSGGSGNLLDSLQANYCGTGSCASGAQPVASAKVGGNGGVAFSDSGLYANGAITAFKVWVDTNAKLINAIQMQYGSYWAPIHGGTNGLSGSAQVVTLSSGEAITAMTIAQAGGQAGISCTCVCYLKFETSQGRTFGPYDGGCGAGSATRYTLGAGLTYIDGRAAWELDAIIPNYCSNTNCPSGAPAQSLTTVGGTGGGPWTDKAYAGAGAITAINIWVDSPRRVIDAIQAQYGTVWAPIHGAANGLQGSVQAFTLNAGEVITAFYLASSNNAGSCNCVCYIKIETSAGRTLGPVDAGCGAGAASRYPVGNGLSYLSGQSGNDLDALALNYCSGKCTGNAKPMASTPKVGGGGGGAFSDLSIFSNGPITAIKIWLDTSSRTINSIQTQYGSVWSPLRGGAAGTSGSPQTVTLNSGESITAVTMAAGGAGITCACYLKFETSQGRTLGPYDAGCGSGSATRYTLGSGLMYFSGAYGNLLDGLQVNYCTGGNCGTGIQTLVQAGGTGGAAFTDQSAFATNGAITGLKIWTDTNWKTIDAIQVQYGSVLATTHGGANGLIGTPQVISLAATETITAVTLNSAAGQGVTTVCICYILIETSAGKTYGPYDAGCGAATATRYALDGGLAYIDGRSGNDLDALTLNYWTSASCGVDPCAGNPCTNGGACTVSSSGNSFSCQCAIGFSGNTCNNVVPDPCASSPCANSGQCTRTGNSAFSCACANGYTGATCQSIIDPCSSNPCGSGGACSSRGTSFTCTCSIGYSGSTCGTVVPDPCGSSPCANSGQCTRTGNNDFSCTCATGYTGATCQSVIDPCKNNPCGNGGVCLSSGTSFSCRCSIGYSGSTCGTVVPDPCANRPCANGGQCTRTGNSDFSCACANGYTGVTCQTAIVTDPCTSSPCLNGGSCTRTSNTAFTCKCTGDYNGDKCQTLIDPCTSSPCLNGGTCVRASSTDYTCFCVPDYDDGDTCAQYQDPCTSTPCENGGTCVRTSSLTFTCTCSASYIGTFCELKAGVDPCSNQPCQHGGSCTTTSKTTYTCACTSKYEGTMCEKIICISNPATDCDLVGTNYGKYAYCSDCGSWAVCKAKKRRTRSCANRAPNVYFSRATKNCTATQSSCAGLTG